MKRPRGAAPLNIWEERDGSPETLIEGCLSHAPGAWQEFLRRYSRLIYATVNRVDLPVIEREDAFQAAIAAIYANLATLRRPAKLVPWIVGITWRQAINSIRKRPPEIRQPRADGVFDGELATWPATEPPPDEVLVSLERAQQTGEALAALSERCRRLIQYFFYEDPQPGYGEIARREGIPIGSLGPTRARCLARMRRYFEERGWL
ncbi:MAG: sigma-70 family RNA polymerase sigma factor [Candidatus Eisenbacteria bacterium]|uniref:Sigma-70 family RNA polymerase sigma factor n=1 Tax=Eiseniibacteriota bacterium TaxID=2212470 RepID=A0A948RYV3_UNCEI|nr:sigma-70 family RNA polymerase sigma factor [Candidatus Eisenbacteria bacterium]